MIDLSTETDPALRAAFAELRAAEQARVVPPGAAVAHRTVRRLRRRRTTAGAAAVMTAVVTVGVGYLAGVGQPDSTGPADPADPAAMAGAGPEAAAPEAAAPADWFTFSADQGPSDLGELDLELAETVAGVLADQPDAIVVTMVDTAPAGRDRGDGLLALSDVSWSGTHRLRVSCGGAGSLEVTVQVGAAAATTTARCGTTAAEIEAGIGETTVAIDAGSELHFFVEPDEAAQAAEVRIVSLSLLPQD